MILSKLIKLAFALFCFVTLSSEIQSHKRIVYLVATTRSAMVETLRMMGERGDFKIMHIPANWAFCHVNNFTHLTKGWYRDDAPTTYAKAKEDILKEAEKADVFVGENSHTAVEFLEQNKDFMKDPRVQFVFLVRDPHCVTISYYDRKKDYFEKLTTEEFSESIGFKRMHLLLDELKQCGKKPLIIDSKDLYYKTKETVQELCSYLSIPFIERSLQWKDISENFNSFEGWYTIELTDCAKHWHMDAIRSTGFTKPVQYAIDEKGNPTFEEIANPQHRQTCIKIYKENLSYYKLLSPS